MPQITWREWIRMVGVRSISRKIGVSGQAVSCWVSGKAYPSGENIVKLIAASEGALQFSDFEDELKKRV